MCKYVLSKFPPRHPLRKLWWNWSWPKGRNASPSAAHSHHQSGGSKIGKFMKQKKPKSTLLADNTQGLITTKQTTPRPVASAAPRPIGGGGETKEISMTNVGVKVLITNRIIWNSKQTNKKSNNKHWGGGRGYQGCFFGYSSMGENTVHFRTRKEEGFSLFQQNAQTQA